MTAKNNAAAKKTAPADIGATSEKEGMPLFFSNPKVISIDRHAQARLRSGLTMKFAGQTNSIPLTIADIAEAAKSYPVVFTQAEVPLPVAIVGLESDNYFVDEQGKWMELNYVPAYARKYPFVFLEMPESDQLTLCVDEDALVFDEAAEGRALYENDEPSTFTQTALQFCAQFQEQHRVTKIFCEKLAALDLLTPQRSSVELANKRALQLNGFQLIDIEKFRALPKETVLELHQQDFLALIHYAIQSQSNWQHLLMLANKREA
ncbi:MAG: SapC family protein [Alphaproteobacteria bacterium]|nr:SapC family protein [Alphaproteobacteria bacterium]